MNYATGLAVGMALASGGHDYGPVPVWFAACLAAICIAVLALGVYVIWDTFK